MNEEQRKFIEAWEYHIRQLDSLAMQSGCTTEERNTVLETLRRWNTDAADKL